MDMKEMTYSKYRTKEVLYEGEYKEHKFVILSLGNHPTAYVEDKIGAVDYDDIRLDTVRVHGGFTYCGGGHWSKESAETRWLGWDYAHAGDFAGYYEEGEYFYYNSKQWTTPEIYDEVKSVIEQLIEIEAKNNTPEAKDVNEMVECGKSAIDDISDVQKVCVALYNAGYRKQEKREHKQDDYEGAKELINALEVTKEFIDVAIKSIKCEYDTEVGIDD